jgi:hypothetical protein
VLRTKRAPHFAASSGHGQTLFGVAKNGFDMAASHARELFEEIVDARAVFEVGEQGLDRHSRSSKYPRAADRLGVSLGG